MKVLQQIKLDLHFLFFSSLDHIYVHITGPTHSHSNIFELPLTKNR